MARGVEVGGDLVEIAGEAAGFFVVFCYGRHFCCSFGFVVIVRRVVGRVRWWDLW